MNRNLRLLTVLGASLASSTLASAQAPAAAAPAPAPAAVAPHAMEAKIALINFEQVVLASNEGQVVTAATQKKYEPKKNQLEALGAEVEAGKKKIASLPASTSDDERASLIRSTDTKEKQLNRDVEDAGTAYNAEWQEALGKVAAKLNTVMQTYVQQNGYTILLDVSSQASNVLWALPSTNVSQAVVDAYNKQSGVAAPPPPSPSAARSNTPRATTPRPAAAKPAGK